MLTQKLDKRRAQGNLRKLSTTQGLIDFASNDYLGLSRSSVLWKNIWEENKKLKRLGSTGSRLLTGNSTYVETLEKRIAAFHGYEAGLIFGCGYMANIGLLSAFGGASFIFDAEVHASIRSGIRLSRSPAYPFRHNDLDHLEERLKKNRPSFVCIESIFSTDGSCAPLAEICCLARKYQACVIVDEAHAVGVLGPEGRGLVAQANLQKEVLAQIVTFGKALGVYGAIVLGSQELK
jgi:8-amino-7-oxononanoate synthase